ncbi:hypothetical protein BHYA_0186g00150 [Botrytis hyacinthi]|uniref:Uncharacterized protein n=1 Tax=Botrytis hyacinthi TaxID=278943 RepID=A0A4Z1GD15_9HELO|nr:hypothetical protein BHYA_0186g00150 [Botrytis hyacinthi]
MTTFLHLDSSWSFIPPNWLTGLIIASTSYPATLTEAAAPIPTLIAPLKLREQLLIPGVYFSDSSSVSVILFASWRGNLRMSSRNHGSDAFDVVLGGDDSVNINFAVRNENEVGCIHDYEILDIDSRFK